MTQSSIDEYRRFIAGKAVTDQPSGFDPGEVVSAGAVSLMPFQAAFVRFALIRGRAGIYADTGLGKTGMAVTWCRYVHEHTGGDLLILAPLAVATQTVVEARKFGVDVALCRSQSDVRPGVNICNYEVLHKMNLAAFVGIALDEASIIKHQDSKTRDSIIIGSRDIPYRLALSATPAPNDAMELGSQSEFLGIMPASEMLAMFFTHDGGSTSNWRLKGHGAVRFWEWMASWCVMVRKPSDLGFSDEGYNLPPLRVHEHVVESGPLEGDLFPKIAQTLGERRAAQRQSLDVRCRFTAGLVNGDGEQWVIWCHLNDESDLLTKLIPDAVDVKGSHSPDEKESRLMGFTNGNIRVLVTKGSIAGFGMNWQHCHKTAFVGLDDSYEKFYQCIRRFYRFGQKSPVDVHIVTADIEGQVKANIERKAKQADEMAGEMVKHMRDFSEKQIKGATVEKSEYRRDVANGDGWDLHLGDCVDVASELADDSIDYTIFSPPFASLYVYSNSDYDMGNVKNYFEFYRQFTFLARQMYRITKPGRLLSMHCMNLQTLKSRDGFIGVHDFRGKMVRLMEKAGWINHSEVTIWKDPVTAMQRTKSVRLLYKQLKKDSAMSGQSLPDYLCTFRKPGDNPDPIVKDEHGFPVNRWQRYASPVWMDINPSKTLQYRAARENEDERHIAPLQLEVIERGIELWSNPGDLVYSPFSGIGSEGYVAIQMGRRFVGSELKASYWEMAQKNLKAARVDQGDLLAMASAE